MSRELPRRFHLLRKRDVHDVSGTGIVAEGVQFTNGYCALTWLSHLTSVTFFHSADVLERIHGHEGGTEIRWDDPPHEQVDDESNESEEESSPEA